MSKHQPLVGRETLSSALAGIPVLVILLLFIAAAGAVFIYGVQSHQPAIIVCSMVGVALAALLLAGLFTVNPNEARVLQLFGEYRASVRRPGLRWANPFYTKKKVSVRVRNFETGKLKVNDSSGNPIEIAAVVVWRVTDTFEALFNVDDYQNFVSVQSESAVRALATHYPYGAFTEEGEVALSSHTAEISEKLQGQVQDRLADAGIEVLETRISHLAYSPEIAAAMLQVQQASAVVAAREKIVEGAVGMVEHALDMLSGREVVELDDERRASMVSNLLVVLCSDRHTQPVVNTGTLHN
ncbi:MAG: SPFH domain-containing protein [Acidobacteriota bacterium]|nr:SPFH domain-containing protein [Acidobacteriota bacterium]